MPVFTPDDFNNIGNGAGNLLKGLGGAIANAACGLYQDYPRSFTGGLADGNPVNQFNRGLWDNLCGSLPSPKLPAPPKPPFTGGRCCDVTYKAIITYTYCGRQGGTGTECQFGGSDVTETTETFVVGEITGVFDGPLFNGVKNSIRYTRKSCAGVTEEGGLFNVGATNILKGYSVSFVPADGSADLCGSPPPDWPPDVAPPSNPGTYDYQPDDGGPIVPIDFNIGFDPTFNGPFVELPDIPNVCIGFELFGVNVDLCTNKPGNGGGGDLGELNDKLDDLGDKLDDIGDGVDEGTNDEPRTEGEPEPLVDENGEPQNSVSKCVENLRYVRVLLTKIPGNANVEKGLGAKDLVDEAGWISFLVNGSYLPPERIYFDNALFEAPEGTNCYAIKLNFGFEASVSHIVKVVE